jgi:hypothetical protein
VIGAHCPVPLSGTPCGLPGALSVTRNVELRAPLLVGVKVTLMVQLELGARPAPPIGQLLVWPKLLALPPKIPMFEMISGEPPELVTVTACGALVVPTVCAGNVSEAGDRVMAAAATPVPFKATLPALFTRMPMLPSSLSTRVHQRACGK